MADFLLRGVPGELWKRVKARAKETGRPLRTCVLELLSAGLEPGQSPGEPPRRIPERTDGRRPVTPGHSPWCQGYCCRSGPAS